MVSDTKQRDKRSPNAKPKPKSKTKIKKDNDKKINNQKKSSPIKTLTKV